MGKANKNQGRSGNQVQPPAPPAEAPIAAVAADPMREALALVTGGAGAAPSTPAVLPPVEPPSPPALAESRILVEETAVVIPCARVRSAEGKPGYVQRRIDLSMESREALALREVFDGLAAAGKFGRPNPSAADAVRWILRQIANARKL